VSITPPAAFETLLIGGWTLRLTFDEDLEPLTEYTVVAAADLQDIYGQTLGEDYAFSFTTADGDDDVTPPEIPSYVPVQGATDVSAGLTELRIIFSEAIDPASLTLQALDYRLLSCGIAEPQWESDDTVLRFDLSGLPAGCEVLVDLGPFDGLAGNPSDDPPAWRFTVAGEAEMTGIRQETLRWQAAP
jgi:hypothetical protein